MSEAAVPKGGAAMDWEEILLSMHMLACDKEGGRLRRYRVNMNPAAETGNSETAIGGLGRT